MFGRKSPPVDEKPLEPELRCSFCNKTQNDVRSMIAGPPGIYICDACVDVCQDILAAKGGPCALCGVAVEREDALTIGPRGLLCVTCTGMVEAAIAERKLKS